MKKLFSTGLALLISVALFAQENSLLWKVSGNGLKKDSYLFGTLHMACESDFKMMDKVKKASAIVESIYFEVDVSDPENVNKIKELTKPNPDFFKDFDPNKKKELDSILTSQQIPPAIFDMVSPATVLSLLSMKSFACEDPTKIKSMEMELKALPELKGKPIGALETIEFQFDLLNNLFTPDDFYTYLTSKDDPKELTKKMVQAYFSENLKDLETFFTASAGMSKEKLELMLDKRNTAWIEKMPALMKEKSGLYAVGAGHLVGKKGIIQLLKDKGYKVTPVKE